MQVDDRLINVELQVERERDFKDRALLLFIKVVFRQIKRNGDDYGGKTKYYNQYNQF